MAPSGRSGLPIIRTDRLVLRDWSAADAGPFAALNADPEVMAHFPSVLTRAESDELIDRVRQHATSEGFSLWAVDAPGGAGRTGFAGFVGIVRPPFIVPDRIDARTVEVGWRLARWAWGQGYATEGALAALDHAFRVHDLEEVVSFTVTGNLRSQAVMDRVGLRRSPDRDFDHPRWEPSWGEALRRHLVWSVDRRSWLGRTDRP